MRTSDASPSKHGMRRGHACDISRKRHALVSRVAVANVLKRCIEGHTAAYWLMLTLRD
jgi:hypothetical protein